MASIPFFTLNDGLKMPSVGMGCWMGTPGGEERVTEMCSIALKNGYRHFDTAAGYKNEKFVGDAIRASGIPRNEIFLTSKLNDHIHVQQAFEDSLRLLDLEYIDLYLMHWPQYTDSAGCKFTPGPDEQNPTFVETYKEMEKLLATGKVKSIGVSNFSIKTLTTLLASCTVVPAVNQVELHPCLPQDDLKAFCDSKGIHLTAYSPIGRGNVAVFTENSIIKSISERRGSTPTQVVLSWGVQRGTSVVPKSENEGRMVANINLPALSAEDMTEINNLRTHPDMHRSLLQYHSEDETVFGWKYEYLGWNMTKGGVVGR
ncbi:aado/keto reductase [Athelia psychrophila]|uniref:Aado/keto reductase n=1 Tax=Athelia psychrophila TaxID=1759441 RepID=A0A166ABV8_9AGAM|nr:aado/keto reductase [Fibularhizoctonia sp. CBS 109695]